MNVVTGPALPVGAQASSTLPNPGNTLNAVAQGNPVVSGVALGVIQAFSAVSILGGGIAPANISANPIQYASGIALTSGQAGATVQVATAGVVTNTQTGVGGWNFVINQPVFIAVDGSLTQTANQSAHNIPIGVAISATAILLRHVPLYLGPVLLADVSGNTPLYTSTGHSFEVTPIGATVLAMQPGFYNAQEVTVMVTQGNPATPVTFTGAAVPSNFIQSTTPGLMDIYKFTWSASKSMWYATAFYAGA